MNLNSKIFIAGHRGMVGSAVRNYLAELGASNVVVAERQQCDLRNRQHVVSFFEAHRPEYVIMAAAHVGGILENMNNPATFLLDNLDIQNNIFHASLMFETEKLLFLGSSCIYPKHAPQPLREEFLLTGPLEPTNESYALAKLAGIQACKSIRSQYGRNFISALPTNLYGPGDNFDRESSHVIPGMIRAFHDAKERGEDSVTLWGSGEARREFLFVRDMARACVFLMHHYNDAEPVNVGTGFDLSIWHLSRLVANACGFTGKIEWDRTKPEGTPRKLLDCSVLTDLGWTDQTTLADGLAQTVRAYRLHRDLTSQPFVVS